jgi:hypothetical protein
MQASLLRLLARLATKPALVAIFLLCAGPTGLMLAEFTPPGQVPDEPAHMARAESLWRGQIIGHRQTMASGPDGKSYISAGVDVNEALFLAAFGQVTSISGRPVVTAQNQQAEQAISRGRIRNDT